MSETQPATKNELDRAARKYAFYLARFARSVDADGKALHICLICVSATEDDALKHWETHHSGEGDIVCYTCCKSLSSLGLSGHVSGKKHAKVAKRQGQQPGEIGCVCLKCGGTMSAKQRPQHCGGSHAEYIQTGFRVTAEVTELAQAQYANRDTNAYHVANAKSMREQEAIKISTDSARVRAFAYAGGAQVGKYGSVPYCASHIVAVTGWDTFTPINCDLKQSGGQCMICKQEGCSTGDDRVLTIHPLTSEGIDTYFPCEGINIGGVNLA